MGELEQQPITNKTNGTSSHVIGINQDPTNVVKSSTTAATTSKPENNNNKTMIDLDQELNLVKMYLFDEEDDVNMTLYYYNYHKMKQQERKQKLVETVESCREEAKQARELLVRGKLLRAMARVQMKEQEARTIQHWRHYAESTCHHHQGESLLSSSNDSGLAA